VSGIFISYRRADSQGWAGRIQEDLRVRFGDISLFFDLETIGPGEDFLEAIQRALGSCQALLALIGPQWASAKNAAGHLRLDDPSDTVRLEIATALEHDLFVVPVLLGGARFPAMESLPPDLAPLGRRNAHELSDARWTYDFERLVSGLVNATGMVVQDKTNKTHVPTTTVGKNLTLEDVEGGDIAGQKMLGNERPSGSLDVATGATIKRSKIGDIVGVKQERSDKCD
jgi:hypothetical protein